MLVEPSRDPISIKTGETVTKVTTSIFFSDSPFIDCLNNGNPPTMRQIVKGYLDKDSIGLFLNPDYRESVDYYKGHGEYTFTLLINKKTLVINPRFRRSRSKLVFDGGDESKIKVSSGWITGFDDETNFLTTSPSKCDAESRFGNDASYLDLTTSSRGIRVFYRFHGIHEPYNIGTASIYQHAPHIGMRYVL